VGADIGATLAKLAIRGEDGITRFRLFPTRGIERILAEIEAVSPVCVGLTGGGAAMLAGQLAQPSSRTDEFVAWRRGAIEMLRREECDSHEPFLLVSLGTGTSAMLIRGDEVTRVGGTALGGGTLFGLGAALAGATSFEQVIELAARGDRRNVDLLVSDIYPSGELPLPGDLNAASFAKLANAEIADRTRAEDLAHSVIGMVGENIGLICGGLAESVNVNRIVYGGSTLRSNSPLVDVLHVMAAVRGQDAVFLKTPEYAGALGALVLALGTVQPEALHAGSVDWA
jgi:type II pantothenate kinase